MFNKAINNHTNTQVTSSSEKGLTKEQWLKKGITHYENLQYKEALEACEQAIQIDPAYARAYHGKGLALTQMKAYEEAKRAYEQANRLAPTNAKICKDMAELFYMLEDYAKSRIFYKKAIHLDKKFEKGYFEKANTLRRIAYQFEHEKQWEEAIKAYYTVLSFNPDDIRARRTITNIRMKDAPLIIEPAPMTNHNNIIHPFNCTCPECYEY
ncbi:tetratricopeptide repeat protein [Dictyobacter arantiisoli]|uniref:Uncharacterized protein n=1 Tax=Dictyobacter arantiisoli TaxID=2014874 RepID=A0A5A5TBS1_9CHLR|nr:tetratricopeptide repeat protein [Dictyobacter arantiisoli]GCF08374.1 hypothetical protein KDI_19380 [Dictyobacter arantiisoli]